MAKKTVHYVHYLEKRKKAIPLSGVKIDICNSGLWISFARRGGNNRHVHLSPRSNKARKRRFLARARQIQDALFERLCDD